MVTAQVDVPLQPPPLHPTKLDPATGAAVSVITVLAATVAAQVAPQLITPPLTDPVPVPDLVTVKVNVTGGSKSNCAFTVFDASTVTAHVDVPLQPPPFHPMKLDPATGAAVSAITVLATTVAAQVAPQLIAPPLTDPVPVPDLVTVKVNVTGGTKSNCAFTVFAASTVTAQVDVPLHQIGRASCRERV